MEGRAELTAPAHTCRGPRSGGAVDLCGLRFDGIKSKSGSSSHLKIWLEGQSLLSRQHHTGVETEGAGGPGGLVVRLDSVLQAFPCGQKESCESRILSSMQKDGPLQRKRGAGFNSSRGKKVSSPAGLWENA